MAVNQANHVSPSSTKHWTGRRLVLSGASVAVLVLTAGCGGGSVTRSSKAAPTPTSTHMGGVVGGARHTGAGTGLLATEDGYSLKPTRAALSVGKQSVSFQILNPRGTPQTEYVVQQTQLLHFYLVRLDLTGYRHLHPTLANGTWSVDVTAAAPGPYRMYADFVAKDSSGLEHPLILSTVLSAPGAYKPVQLPAPATATTADGLTSTLTGTITAGVDSSVTFQITEAGKPVADLEQYLDSYAHLTALHVGDAAYQHVHPARTATTGQKGGPALPFSVDLPEKGTWRLFLQVQRSGSLHLLPLTVNVS
jgi:hypothetical protein